MNEQAVNQVITDYAIENANLKLTAATLRNELEKANKVIAEQKEADLQEPTEDLDTAEEEK